MTRRRRPAPAPAGVAGGWTIPRATLAGLMSGLAAILLAGFAGQRLLLFYAALLGLTIICGLSILLITVRDIKARARGIRVRPIRAFDVIIGLALALPAGYGLLLVWPDL